MKDNKTPVSSHDFGSLVAEQQEVANLLPEGEHVVTIKEVSFDYANGFKKDGVLQYTDKMPQATIICEDDKGRTITIWDALKSLKRMNELEEDDLPNPEDVGVDPKKWAKMTFEDKVEHSFTSYQDSEGNDIAVRIELDEKGNVQRGERIHLGPDHERTQKMLGKLKSLVVHAGHPEGTAFTAKTLPKMLLGKTIGVNIGAGQRNNNGKVMPKVLWTLDPEKVTSVD